MPDKLITPLTGNSKPVYTSPEDYYNKNMKLLEAGLYQPKEIRSDCMPYFGWKPFTSLLSYNNDPLQLISAIAKGGRSDRQCHKQDAVRHRTDRLLL